MRREFTNTQRAAIVHRAMNGRGQVVCEGCGLVLGKKPYDIDHTIPEALIVDKSRALTIDDGKLLGVACCHRGGINKTAQDVADIAKAKRRELKNLGLAKPSGFRKPPPGFKYSWKSRRMEREAT